MSANRRKVLLIDPPFQISLVKSFFLLSLVNFAIFYVGNMVLFGTMYRYGTQVGLDDNHPYFDFLKNELLLVHGIYFVLLPLSALLFFYVGYRISNKIAGPLYNLKRSLREHIEGNSEKRVKFRQNDYFHEVADVVNEVLDKK